MGMLLLLGRARCQFPDSYKEKMMQLDLTVAELDYVLKTLAQRPFAEVHELIAKILAQANAPADPAA